MCLRVTSNQNLCRCAEPVSSLLAEIYATFKLAFSWPRVVPCRFTQIAGQTVSFVCANAPSRLIDETLWTGAPFGKADFSAIFRFYRLRESPGQKMPSLAGRDFTRSAKCSTGHAKRCGFGHSGREDGARLEARRLEPASLRCFRKAGLVLAMGSARKSTTRCCGPEQTAHPGDREGQRRLTSGCWPRAGAKKKARKTGDVCTTSSRDCAAITSPSAAYIVRPCCVSGTRPPCCGLPGSCPFTSPVSSSSCRQTALRPRGPNTAQRRPCGETNQQFPAVPCSARSAIAHANPGNGFH